MMSEWMVRPGSQDFSRHQEGGLGPRDFYLFFAIMTLGLLARLASMAFFTGSIDWEGAEYARLAQNLLAGNGYIGIDLPGKNLMFPPLYPILIAAVSILTPDFELAARLISIAAGTLLAVPIFLLCQLLYNKPTAYLAAVLVSVHPMLVHFSATTYSESTYLLFVVAAIYLSIRGLQSQTALAFGIAGAVFGLAYLTRIEATPLPFLVFAICLVKSFWADKSPHWKAVLKAACLPTAFLILAAPYIAWLHLETNQWRFEGKSPLNVETVKRVALDGENLLKVEYGINSDLSESGIWNRPYMATIQVAKFEPAVIVHLIWARAGTALYNVGREILSPSFGTPLLFGLTLLGLFSSPWRRGLFAGQSIMIMYVSIASLETLLDVFSNYRFTLPLLPFFLIWAAAGAFRLVGLATAMAQRSSWTRSRASLLGRVACGVALIVPLGISCAATPRLYSLARFNDSTRLIRDVGRQLSPGGLDQIRMAEAFNIFSYYSEAQWVPFPFANSDTVLQYFNKKKIDYLVLRESDAAMWKFVKTWMQNGIPSSRAIQIYSGVLGTGENFRIYKWIPEDAGGR